MFNPDDQLPAPSSGEIAEKYEMLNEAVREIVSEINASIKPITEDFDVPTLDPPSG